MTINFMENNLNEGEKAEILLVNIFAKNPFIKNMQRIGDRQKEGIDGSLEFKGKVLMWDLKVRKNSFYMYNDILIEIETGSKPGWFYSSCADLIFYCWWNKEETKLIDGYVIPLQKRELRDWFENYKRLYGEPKVSYSSNKETGEEWRTLNIPVQINDFPKETILHLKL